MQRAFQLKLWCPQHEDEAKAKGLNLHVVGVLLFEKFLNDVQAAAAQSSEVDVGERFAEASKQPLCCYMGDDDREAAFLTAPRTTGSETGDIFVMDQYSTGQAVKKGVH